MNGSNRESGGRGSLGLTTDIVPSGFDVVITEAIPAMFLGSLL